MTNISWSSEDQGKCIVMEENLSILFSNAKSYGAVRVFVLPTSWIVIDPRMRLKWRTGCSDTG